MADLNEQHAQLIIGRVRELAPLRTVEELRAYLVEAGILVISASDELVWSLAYAQARFLMAELADIAEDLTTDPAAFRKVVREQVAEELRQAWDEIRGGQREG